METTGNWFRKNASTIVILMSIFGLALFLRAYFPLDISLRDHLLSGGSDSFYYERVIRNVVNTGHQLDWDPMLNYPMGLGNPRPPLFNWLIAVPGMALSPLFGDVWQSVMTVFILSTAIWGALTIFPTYFLTKSIFGRRAGLIAAFLLAVMPAHLQRSQATDADHDSMVLFFVVTSFYFFMKALQVLNEKRWVASWNFRTKEGRHSIWSGVKDFLKSNQKSVLYSVMSGLAMAAVALIWQGWAYAPIILLVYVVIQLFVDRLRDKDPMAMGICFTITMSVALLLAAPWYVLYGQIKVWYDVPLILFLAATALGLVLTVTRNYPWAMVIPSVLVVGGGIVGILAIANPAVASAFVSGAGYFVRTKLYETIAEAQPPGLSQAILSFGAATYYLSLFGLFWMAWKLPKRFQSDYLFILTWSFAAVFMSMAAARFIFNASPAFALTAGWVISILVEKLDFEKMKKTFSSLSGGSKLTAFRKSVKVRHILGSLFIVFLLLLPNVWYGVDASIPYEQKAMYDRQVYYGMPEFMRPQDYTPPATRSGSTFYFGAFGYSLPLKTGYFPAAWDWFSQQDRTIQPEQRPAYLSWWDYGFEAVDRGAHPTVADNFQDGYQLAGQFITAQSEDQAIALLILRLIDGDYYGNKGRLSPAVSETLQRYDIDPSKVTDSYRNSAPLVSVVLSDPIKYGRWDSRMQPTNALYIYLSKYIHEKTTTDQIASLYHDLRETTGWSIRYFGIDSRMFPYDGGGNNIFYAPVKLSDHRVQDLPDGRVLPIDFFNIEAQTDKGTFPAALVPLGARVTSYDIKYTDMFYNSMFYRAYMGFGPSDIGQTCSTNDCLPGIRGELQSTPPMQAWGLSHFKAVYKTAYYNPWSIYEVQNHTEDWTAMNYFDALELQRRISRNLAVGVIDFTNSTLARSGVVFLKYYDGAYVNGTVTVDGVTPLRGVRMTVQDYEDPPTPTPHYTTLTDENGRYSLLVPFGSLRVVASVGALDKRTMTGATILDQEFITVTDDQSMRKNVDRNRDGKLDYEIDLDISVRGVSINGKAFLDYNMDGNLTDGEDVLANAEASFEHKDLHTFRNVTTNSDGEFLLTHAYEGTHLVTFEFRGRTIQARPLSVGKVDATKNIPVNTTKLEGDVWLPGNFAAVNAEVDAFDELWGQSITSHTSNVGHYEVSLLPGNYSVTSSIGFNSSLPQRVEIGTVSPVVLNMTLMVFGSVTGKTSVGGIIQGHVLLDFKKVGNSAVAAVVTSDRSGTYSVRLPTGFYDVSARHYRSGSLYAFIGRVLVNEGIQTEMDATLSEGVAIDGIVYSIDKVKGALGLQNISFSNGIGMLTVKSSVQGRYIAYLPKGDYVVQAGLYNLTYLRAERFEASRSYDVSLEVGSLVNAQIMYDRNKNGFSDIGESIFEARVTFTDSSGTTAETFTNSEGHYQLTLPSARTYIMNVRKTGFQPVTFGPATLQSLGVHFTSRLVPINTSVTGVVKLGNVPLTGEPIQVSFAATSDGAINASVFTNPSSGAYSTFLTPGDYTVEVDQAIDITQPLVRYQNVTIEPLSVDIGQASATKDVPVSLRAEVKGVTRVNGLPRDALVVFQGPEARKFSSADGTFSIMLAQGTYSVYVNYSQSGTPYAIFRQVTVSDPVSLDLNLERAAVVSGNIEYPRGSVLPEVAPVTFVSDMGARFETLTSDRGNYSVNLAPGIYTITVEHHGNASFEGINRLVRYDGTIEIEVLQNDVSVSQNLVLTRSLDNTTVTGLIEFQGLPAAASLEFRSVANEGINVSASAAVDGTYILGISPGDYYLYAHDFMTHGVLIQQVTIPPRTTLHLNLSLLKGYRVSGITTYLDNVRLSSEVRFLDSIFWAVQSDSSGHYELYVPPLGYRLRALSTIMEHGMNVDYDVTSFVDVVDGPRVVNLHLERVPKRDPFLSYDKTQVRSVAVGAEIQYLIEVSNRGNMLDTIRLEGATVGWTITFDRNPVYLDFGTKDGEPVNETMVVATIAVPPDAKVEHPTVGITAISVNETAKRYTLYVDVEVERTRGLVLRASDTKPSYDGRFLNQTLELVNTGNGVESVVVSVENSGSLSQIGWAARIMANSTAEQSETVSGIIVAANSTSKVTVVIQNKGGRAGVEAIIKARLQSGTVESTVRISTALPSLHLQGTIAVSGSGIERTAPINATLVAITASLGIVAAIFVISSVRDRWRKSRR